MSWVCPITLEGGRARLIPLEREHADALYAASRGPKVWTYLPTRAETVDEMRAWVDAALEGRERGAEMPFTIEDRETNRIAGSTRFMDIAPAHRNLEIGWTWLDPAVWRTRINTECKYLLLSHCFQELGALRVTFKTDARNLRSQRALQRIGALREGVLRRHRVMPDGYIRDSVYFGITDLDWPAVRMHLEELLGAVH